MLIALMILAIIVVFIIKKVIELIIALIKWIWKNILSIPYNFAMKWCLMPAFNFIRATIFCHKELCIGCCDRCDRHCNPYKRI